MFKGATKSRVIVTAAIAAMWLTACGGGGGGGDGANAPAPDAGGDQVAAGPNPPAPPAPAPGTGSGTPAPAPATGSPAPAPGTGTGAPAPAPEAGPLAFSPTTGSTAPARSWHWVTTNPAGTVMAAAAIPGGVHVSTDGGESWTATSLSDEAIWISIDMSADGTQMVAVALNGQMVRSMNSGQSWEPIDTAFNPSGNALTYESVTVSEFGDRIVAVDLDGNIYTSVNGNAETPTFTTETIAGAQFRAVDGSAGGAVVVAAGQQGGLHMSVNGAPFAPLPVTVDGTVVTDNWYRVSVSDNGDTIAVAGNTDYAGPTSTGVYVSRDRGATWTRGIAEGGSYSSIDMSGNGGIIVVTRSGAGQVLLSTNAGTSFAPIATPEGELNWRASALSGNASRLVIAAGTFGGAATGLLYRSSGSVTGQ